MEATGSRIHKAWQRVEGSILELRQLTILHQQRRQRMALFRELHENAGVGRWTCTRPFEDGQVQLVEQNLAQLQVRVNVEFRTRDFIDLALHGFALGLKALLERSEPWQIDCNAGPFHLGENVDERKLDAIEEPSELV